MLLKHVFGVALIWVGRLVLLVLEGNKSPLFMSLGALVGHCDLDWPPSPINHRRACATSHPRYVKMEVNGVPLKAFVDR
jgi:hypothetical protein